MEEDEFASKAESLSELSPVSGSRWSTFSRLPSCESCELGDCGACVLLPGPGSVVEVAAGGAPDGCGGLPVVPADPLAAFAGGILAMLWREREREREEAVQETVAATMAMHAVYKGAGVVLLIAPNPQVLDSTLFAAAEATGTGDGAVL